MSSPTLDSAPLLPESRRRSLRRQSLRQAARFLRQATSRGTMREPSLLVREAAAEHLEERQSDWAYSKPVVIIDIAWNIGFILAAIVVLFMSLDEEPDAPLRVWIAGYALQCFCHVVCVLLEFRKRRQRRWRTPEEAASSGNSGLSSEEGYVTLAQFTDEGASSDAAKHLGSVNTMFSFVWWLLGFYWVSDAGRQLIEESPLLYWLCLVFLAIDVFFVVFFVALACVIGVAICCFLPCIIAILYALEEQEGASKEEVERLAKYKFRLAEDAEQKYSDDEMQGPGGVMTECETHSERYLASEDAECCICLCAYGDGAELRELPCGHHFHCTCVDKWLFINATCPLCKYNIMQSLNSSSQEV